MADRDVDVLIVGTGPAGTTCATTLREDGYTGSILLVGREPDAPYDRPPSSKEYLAGDKPREALLLQDAGWWAEHDVELLTRTMVMKLDTDAHEATLANKTTVGYGQLVLATGANLKRLRVDGAALDGIHYLRVPDNADALRADVADHERVVCVGGSYIACEVAATLTGMGKSVTLVAMEAQPLENGFGADVGAWVAGRLREHDIELRLGETLAAFEGEDRVAAVVTESGERIPADVVVMGTGATPDAMLASRAGLRIGECGGIHCDARLRASAPDVWAAGDVCRYESVVHGGELRVEHWEHATAQGRHVAKAIMGDESPFDTVPYFWSDLGDWLSYESVGPASEWDAEVVRGSFDDGEFTVFYLRDGRVVQALTVGRSDDLDAASKLIASGERADVAALERTG